MRGNPLTSVFGYFRRRQTKATTMRGILSYEIREKGSRVGFAVETLSGEKGILAHVDFESEPSVSKYRVSVQDIDTIIIPELIEARKTEGLIVIDEIAKMEIFSESFASEVRRCLETRRVLGTIQQRSHPFLEEVRSRSDVEIFRLTIINRDQIPLQILQLLKS